MVSDSRSMASMPIWRVFNFCLLWNERTANKIRWTSKKKNKTKSNHKCRTICNKSLLAKKSSEVSKRTRNFVFKLLSMWKYSIHAKYVPNWMKYQHCKWNQNVASLKPTESTERMTLMMKRKKKPAREKNISYVVRQNENGYHLTICNSIHFFSCRFLFLRIRSHFEMMGWMFMQGIHIACSHVCETRWLNKRARIVCAHLVFRCVCVCACNLLLVVTNDSCLQPRNQRSWCEFPLMHATDCNLNSMPWRCFFLSFYHHTHSLLSNHRLWVFKQKKVQQKVKTLLFHKKRRQ